MELQLTDHLPPPKNEKRKDFFFFLGGGGGGVVGVWCRGGLWHFTLFAILPLLKLKQI